MTISGPSQDPPSYKEDFQRSVKLFEKSFQEMQKSKLDAQKDQYVKVMHESLRTMQESASGMINKRLGELKNTLSKDLDNYLASPTKELEEKVENDISQIKEAD